jgi:NADH dehydrogenase [ubiquinone] 1 alpha subcomplex assembly factor 7
MIALPVYSFQYDKGVWREVLVDITKEETGFRYVLSPNETQATKAFAHIYDDPHYKDFCVQDTRIEISPETWSIANDIGTRIKEDGGMALIADYGGNGNASLRGVLNHEFVDILNTEPGTCDITADVDFSLLKRGSFGLGILK